MGWPWNRSKEELSEELEFHLRMIIEGRIANGEDPATARAAAMREFGNVPLIKDVTRERWGYVWLENSAHDLRYALRQLRRLPGFTITVLMTLAFGIGANLAVFQLLYSVILAKLPVVRPEEVVTVEAAKTPFDTGFQVSYAAYQRLRMSTATDAPLIALTGPGLAPLQSQSTSDDSLRAQYQLVSDNFFSVLGVGATAGRVFIQADAVQEQSEWPAVVRYDFARGYFGSAQQAVGQHVRLNGIAVNIVGVADRRFLGLIPGNPPDFWLPLEANSAHFWVGFDSLGPGYGIHLKDAWLNQPGIFWLTLVARIPVDRRQAVGAKWDQVFQADRELMASATVDPVAKVLLLHKRIETVPADHGLGGLRKRSSAPLYLLMALSASIFMVGCLNLANLQLARLSVRAQELGIRMALGASRWRLARQVLMENAILVILGGASAFLVGRAASGILVHWASGRGRPLTIDLHPNLSIAVLGIGLMVLALVSFSLLPAMHFIRTNLTKVAGSRAKISGISQTRGQRWRSSTMLATQVSLSLLLATMAGCFGATLVHWETIDVGMDREHILSVNVDVGRHSNLPALYRDIRERLQALPEVRSAAVELCRLPNCGWNTALYVYGRSGLSDAQVHGEEDHVGPGFFQTMAIPLLRGRDFSETDTDDTPKVAIVSHSYAHQLFGDENPIGHWVGYDAAPNDHQFLIVGEVADARVDGPRNDPPAVVYMSIDQNPYGVHSIRVRALGDPSKISVEIRQVVHEIDPDLHVNGMVPLAAELNEGLGTEKLLARLASVYAGLTLLLVGIGFYGVMSSRTSRRKSEFGVRLALGATRRQIEALILRQTARVLLVGMAPGLLLSIATIWLTRHLLFGSVSANSVAVVGAAVVLAIAGFLATMIPARRAALADTLETLRSE
jgi:predicted permease